MVSINVIETRLEKCDFKFVETVPSECQFAKDTKYYPKIGEKIIKMLKKAKISVKIISFYFSLRAKDNDGKPCKPTYVGEQVYKQLEEAAKRGVNLYLLANKQNESIEDNDMIDLEKLYPEKVHIGFVDMSHKTEDFIGGVCHTKLWIVDDKYFYLGSANACWKSCSENVETGIIGKKCSTILNKLNEIYVEHWKLADNCKTKSYILSELCNNKTTLLFSYPVTISTSPNVICDSTQTQNDLISLLDVINTSDKYICLTTFQYATHDFLAKPPLFDLRVESALIAAATQKKVNIKIIIDHRCLNHKTSVKSLSYLSKINQIDIKVFNTKEITKYDVSFTRLYHSKLAASESKLWISTNNIEPGYFLLTCGIGILFDSTKETTNNSIIKLVKHATDHFMRYWNCDYVNDFNIYDTSE